MTAPTTKPDDEERLPPRQRRDIVTGEVKDEAELIRFVLSPDSVVTPDLGRKLPGRGLWTAPTREAVDTAARKGLFSRAAKQAAKAPEDLSDLIERLLLRRCLDQLGLARREGGLVTGFEKTLAAVKSGKTAWLISASDGAEDGRRKISAVAAHVAPAPQIFAVFNRDELSLALGLENVIHAALLIGARAQSFSVEASRLAGFRPLKASATNLSGRSG